MRKYYKILFGISLLLSLSGCTSSVSNSVENKEVQTEEKEQADLEAKEKSAYQLLEEAIKKNEEWTSWGVVIKKESRESDFFGYYDGVPIESKNTYYKNIVIKDNTYYSVEDGNDDLSTRFEILKMTDTTKIFISGHYFENQSPNAQFVYQKSDSSKEAFATACHPINSIPSFEDSELFNSTITQENGKTVLSFDLKDSEKFHDYLVETENDDGKTVLDNGVELDRFHFDTYSWSYTINEEGYIEAYQYELYQKYTDELESFYKADNQFFDIDSITLNTDVINQLIDALPKDKDEGGMQGDFSILAHKPE